MDSAAYKNPAGTIQRGETKRSVRGSLRGRDAERIPVSDECDLWSNDLPVQMDPVLRRVATARVGIGSAAGINDDTGINQVLEQDIDARSSMDHGRADAASEDGIRFQAIRACADFLK